MTTSWHMTVEFTRALTAFVVSGEFFSFAVRCDSRERVIAIPAVEIGRGAADKFTASSLTQMPSARASAPLIAECFAIWSVRFDTE